MRRDPWSLLFLGAGAGLLLWKWRTIVDSGVDLDWGLRHALEQPLAGRMTMVDHYQAALYPERRP